MSIADIMSTLQGVEYRIDGVSLVFDGDDVDFRELVAYFTENAPCEVTNSGKTIFISPKKRTHLAALGGCSRDYRTDWRSSRHRVGTGLRSD